MTSKKQELESAELRLVLRSGDPNTRGQNEREEHMDKQAGRNQ